MQVPNIYNSTSLDSYKKICLGINFNDSSFHCKACTDFQECMNLYERWKERCVRRFIFTKGVHRISRKRCTTDLPAIEKRPSKEDLLEEIRKLDEIMN